MTETIATHRPIDASFGVKSVEVLRSPAASEPNVTRTEALTIVVHNRDTLDDRLLRARAFAMKHGPTPLGADPAWLKVFQTALKHDPYLIEAIENGRLVGVLPLSHVSSLLFGHFLVSLPYLNCNGPIADSMAVKAALVQRAADLAEELGVKHLELRNSVAIEHSRLNVRMDSKVHMRRELPATAELLWKSFDPKVRNQVRKAEKSNFEVLWGGFDLLDDFMTVIEQNMRDLGTPFYGKAFFAAILEMFPNQAEMAVLRSPDGKAVAAGLLLHGSGITEVPSASSLKEFNSTCANMLLYRHLLDRAIGRGQSVFDFGRSTPEGPTFKFKKQWGALPSPAIWQYASRSGSVGDARPDNPKYAMAIKVWKKLPVWLTSKIGPVIVRGIP